MSFDETPPWRRSAAELTECIIRWAAETGRGEVTDVKVPESGMSNETLLFRLDGKPLVARLAPSHGSPFPLFPTHDLAGQAQTMRVVEQKSSVPVPHVEHLEMSVEWLGTPFLLMEQVEGVVPGDYPPYTFGGWLLEASEQEQETLEESSIGVLVELHRIVDDEDTAHLQPSAPGDTSLARQLAFQRSYYDWACEGTPVPIIEHAFEVLTATMPETERSVLLWGDSRIGNIIFSDFRPAAVLDWEMATVGPPEVDVAWMTFFHSFFHGVAEQLEFPGLPNLFGRSRAVEIYERLSGTQLDDLAWYEGFAALRFAIISIRTTLRSVHFGQQAAPENPDDVVMFIPLFRQILAEL
jgi:aminoglycoside phosphotransferase (APT) family kinase protein